MHIHKTSRLAAAIALAAALSACGADGDENGNGGNGGGGQTSSQFCDELDSQAPGVTPPVQGAICDVTNGVPGVNKGNDLLNELLVGTPLAEIITQLNEFTPEEINELLQTLLGGDGALAPLTSALNAVLIGLLSGDPESVAAALQGFGGDGGSGGGTGTPLDALLALGGEDNPITALLGALGGGLPGSGGGTGGNDGLITNVQDILNNLTGNTPLFEVANLVDSLINPQSGGLAPLTQALEDLTNVDGGPLGPLTELVGALVSANDAALAPVITALNQVLVGLLTDQDPAAIATALQNLASGLQGSGGDNPLAGLLPGAGGDGSGGNNDGLITSVQSTVDNLLGNTVLTPVQDLVTTLVDPDNGALSPLTGIVEQITGSEEALGQVTALVNELIAQDDAALTPVIEALNGVLSLGDISGGGTGLPGLDSTEGLDAIPVIGPVLSGLLGGLLGGLPI